MHCCRPRLALGPLVVCCLAAFLGCAQEVGDIDRTQPNLLDKAMFRDHAWYVRQTVIDVPPTSTFSFVGETGEMEVIRWEIQQDYLVGYRAYEKVPGSEENADHDNATVADQPVTEGTGEGRDKDVFKGNPIVAYEITDHVDVLREYNPRTGEQTNVIVENTDDRPWYERNFMRVDWSTNKVGNFLFISSVSTVTPTNSGYVEENEGGPDAFLRHEDRDGDVDYFDFTERLFVEPSEDGCILSQRLELGDCTGAEIKVRTSFLRVDPDREQDYEPLRYGDDRQGEFGYFRTERPSYDRRRGVTWTGVSQLANRHDLWFDSRDQDGELRDYRDRGLRPLVYTLSPNYPESLRDVTDEIVAEWDSALKQTVAKLRRQQVSDLETDLRAETGESCMFCLDDNSDGHARIGDLRYNFLYWVDAPQLQGPLGYGPSSANPETGRIVAGMAYVYGSALDVQAEYAKDVVDLLNGDRQTDDYVDAEFIREQIDQRRPKLSAVALEDLEAMDLDTGMQAMLTEGQHARLQSITESGLPPAKPGWDRQRLSIIEDSPLASMLINDEMILGHSHGQVRPTDVLTDEFRKSLSPAQWATTDALRAESDRHLKAAKHNLWLAELNDPTVMGLAKAVKDMELEGDELWQYLRERIYLGVMLHEIGHTVGLRHNFGASADALNYLEEYWPLRARTMVDDPETVEAVLSMACEVETEANAGGCQEQRDGRMTEYRYSSVMDYAAAFNADIHGLGRYDMAAIAAGYGSLVEVFEDEVRDAMDPDIREEVATIADFQAPLFGSLPERFHYTELPDLFGGIEAMNRRRWIPREEYERLQEEDNPPLRVPYIACYDEYVDATPTCHRYDQGADPLEIVNYYVTAYREYYPLLNFQRDRVGFSSLDVRNRVTSRYFLPINNMYQHWLFSRGYSTSAVLNFYSEAATTRGISLLWEVLATPHYGSYQMAGDTYQWMGYGENEGADLYLPPGQGRREFSRYDTDNGYNVFQRIKESGYFYEQIGALVALTNNDARVLGIGSDVDADELTYSIPYYLVFQEEVDELLTGIASQDTASYGPSVTGDGRVIHKDLFLEAYGLQPEPAAQLEVTTTRTTRLYSMLYGMALLSSNFDLNFLHKGQVVLAGESEPLSIAEGFEEVSVTDPQSGRTYVSYYDPEADMDSYLGAKLILQTQELIATLGATTPGSNTEAQLRFEIDNKFEDLDILRAMYSEYQYVF